MQENEETKNMKPAVGNSIPYLLKGVIGFVISFSAAFVLEALVLLLLETIFNTHLMPRGLGWIIIPVVCGVAGYKKLESTNFQAAFLSTPAQRIAFLSLCLALLLFVGQLVIYVANIGRFYWNYFWEGLSYCLSIGSAHQYGCEDNPYRMISRSLMYLNILWAFLSLMCMLFWQCLKKYKAVVQTWIEKG